MGAARTDETAVTAERSRVVRYMAAEEIWSGLLMCAIQGPIVEKVDDFCIRDVQSRLRSTFSAQMLAQAKTKSMDLTKW